LLLLLYVVVVIVAVTCLGLDTVNASALTSTLMSVPLVMYTSFALNSHTCAVLVCVCCVCVRVCDGFMLHLSPNIVFSQSLYFGILFPACVCVCVTVLMCVLINCNVELLICCCCCRCCCCFLVYVYIYIYILATIIQ